MYLQIIAREFEDKIIATYGMGDIEAARAAYVGYEYFFSSKKEVTREQIITAVKGIVPAVGNLI